MKIEWNWGKGIVLILTIFMGSMIAFFIYTLSLPENLVMEEYYEADLTYQTVIDKKNRTNALSKEATIVHDSANQRLLITYPQIAMPRQFNGDVHLFRPDNDKLDQHYPVQTDSTFTQSIDISALKAGLWKCKLNWNVDSTGYLNEDSFTR
jgi:hypothetical protein